MTESKETVKTEASGAVASTDLLGNPGTMKYVVGFMFDEGMANVALIRKQKPKWQAGLLNGIGGKQENGEAAITAMVREFEEEAGLHVGCNRWTHFCAMSGTNNDGGQFAVDFFYVVGEPHRLTSMEAEQIEVVDADEICAGHERTIGNLPWLVALARDFGRGVYPPAMVMAQYLPNDAGERRANER